jgi:GNAT superfamily N-acetyltransferase
MKRRDFISRVGAGSLAVAAAPAAGRGRGEIESRTAGPPGLWAPRPDQAEAGKPLKQIGPYSLEKLRDYFRRELEEEIVPYWEKYGVDRQSGGYLIADRNTGAYTTTDKDLYSQGRILWVFSYLYDHFGRNPAHLQAARQGKEALVKHCRVEDGHWGTLYTRDWTLKKAFFDIYADIYMVLGLAEYFKATGDEEALRLAVETSYVVNRTILAPHYQGQGHGPFYEPGIKRLGTWVHFLFPLTLLLSYAADEGLERTARMCVRNIIERHWDRKKAFAYEYLNDKFEPYSKDYLSDYRGEHDYTHYISGWHSIQAAFKVMLEALRVGVREMFLDGHELGLQTLRGHFEEREDCRLMEFENEEMWRKKQGNNLKPYYALYDVFVFCLLAIEHTHAPEAAAWFEKTFTCAMTKPEKLKGGNLTLHEPRGVMFCLEILERMIARGGRVSDFLMKS